MDVNIGYDPELSINPKEISGKWRAGWALDAHTLSSIHLGNQMFDTKRTELGELVYLLKYHDAIKSNDRTKIQPIAKLASKFVKEEFKVNDHFVYGYLEAIIPVPPSEKIDIFNL